MFSLPSEEREGERERETEKRTSWHPSLSAFLIVHVRSLFHFFIGSDLNEEVPNHPANERTVKHPDTPPDLSLSLLLSFSSSSYFLSFTKKKFK